MKIIPSLSSRLMHLRATLVTALSTATVSVGRIVLRGDVRMFSSSRSLSLTVTGGFVLYQPLNMVLDRVSIEINIIIFFFKNTNFFFTWALSHPYFFYNLYSFPPVLGIRRVEQGQGDVFWVRLEPISGQTLLHLVQITLAQIFPARLSLLQKESRCLERPVLAPEQEKDGEIDLDQVLRKSLKIWS